MKQLAQKAWVKGREEGIRSLLESTHRFLSRIVNRWIVAHSAGDVFTLRNITLNLSDADVSTYIKAQIARGEYESGEADAIDEYLPGNLDVVDLGGCIGYTACYADKKLREDATHVVAEPNDQLISTLQRNRELNNCSFEILNAAYASTESTVTLGIPENTWGASLLRDGEQTITVNAVDLQTIIDDFDISEFCLIADIEGAEADLIKNELDLLENLCELLLIEFHHEKDVYGGVAGDIQEARERLSNSSFRLVEEDSTGIAVYVNES